MLHIKDSMVRRTAFEQMSRALLAAATLSLVTADEGAADAACDGCGPYLFLGIVVCLLGVAACVLVFGPDLGP
eukprot:SAG31_NODE_7765_length_1601_cov_7.420772_1_plen_72_part_10